MRLQTATLESPALNKGVGSSQEHAVGLGDGRKETKGKNVVGPKEPQEVNIEAQARPLCLKTYLRRAADREAQVAEKRIEKEGEISGDGEVEPEGDCGQRSSTETEDDVPKVTEEIALEESSNVQQRGGDKVHCEVWQVQGGESSGDIVLQAVRRRIQVCRGWRKQMTHKGKTGRGGAPESRKLMAEEIAAMVGALHESSDEFDEDSEVESSKDAEDSYAKNISDDKELGLVARLFNKGPAEAKDQNSAPYLTFGGTKVDALTPVGEDHANWIVGGNEKSSRDECRVKGHIGPGDVGCNSEEQKMELMLQKLEREERHLAILQKLDLRHERLKWDDLFKSAEEWR